MTELAVRRKTRTINVGGVKIGSGYPISIQSMCNTKTADISATLCQLEALAAAGAQIGRLAVLDTDRIGGGKCRLSCRTPQLLPGT